LLLLTAGGLGLWWLYQKPSGAPTDPVEQALRRLQQHLEHHRYAQPAGDNALAALATLERLSPGNPAIAPARRRLTDTLQATVEAALAAGNTAGARAAIVDGRRADPKLAVWDELARRAGDREADNRLYRRELEAGTLAAIDDYLTRCGMWGCGHRDEAGARKVQVLEQQRRLRDALARMDAGEGSPVPAEAAIDALAALAALVPKDPSVQEGREQILALEEEIRQKRLREIRTLYNRMEHHLEREQYTRPDGQNALEDLRRLERLAPNDPAIPAARRRMTDRIAEQARMRIERWELRQARERIAQGRLVDAELPVWEEIERHLATAKPPLRLELDPPGTKVLIAGSGLQDGGQPYHPGLKLPVGEYRLKAGFPGYLPREVRLQHEDNAVRTVSLQAWPERLHAVVQDGHRNDVSTVAWSPNGKLLASASSDDTVRLWETGSGKTRRTLSGHTDVVRALAWSPDNELLASGSDDNTVRVWNARSGKLVRSLEAHQGNVRAVAWSPDGKVLASGGDDLTVRLWRAAGGALMHTLEGHSWWVRTLAWSPDGKMLASGSADKTVRLWNARSGELVRILEGHQRQVRAVTWSPDSATLASASDDGTVRLWQISGAPLRTLEGHKGYVRALAWAPDGQSLASGGGDNSVRLWDTASGKPRRTLEGVQKDWGRAAAWSPDRKALASGSEDNMVRVWRVDSRRPPHALEGHKNDIEAVAWSPDGKFLASGSLDHTIRLWDPDRGKLLHTLRRYRYPVLSVSWSPDGKLLASGGGDNGVRLWDPARTHLVHTLQGHKGAVRALAWSPDSEVLASGGDDDTVRLWYAEGGTPFETLTGHAGDIRALAWSPTSNVLASASADNTVRLWDRGTGKLLHTLHGHKRGVLAVAWSPDGRLLASGGEDKTALVWNGDRGELLRALDEHQEGYVQNLAWSPDGKVLISGSADGSMSVWLPRTGTRLATIRTLPQSGYLTLDREGRYFSGDPASIIVYEGDLKHCRKRPDLVELLHRPDIIAHLLTGELQP
jgi:WD40 repeat protein